MVSLLILVKHEFSHLFLIFFFFLEIKHGSKYMIPDGGANAKTLVLIFIMMQVMIAP